MALDINAINRPNSRRPVKKTNGATSQQINAILQKDYSFKQVFNDRRKEAFYSELVILLSAGLDLKGAIDIVAQGYKDLKLKKILEELSDQLVHGSSLSQAIEHHGSFTPFEFFSIKIGEESGRLSEVFGELGKYFQKKIKQRKQLVSAFSYPIVIFVTAVAAVFFMMNFIVPLFADAFKRFNSDLPALTRYVIALSHLFREGWWVFLGLIVALGVAVMSLRKQQRFQQWWGTFVLKLPLFGPLVQKVYLARFCQAMALMTASRTPLIQALKLTSRMVGLYPFEVAILQIEADIYQGKLLYEAMAKFEVFEPRMVSLIKVGEETNRLDEIFKRLYDQYVDDTDHQTALMSTLLEPLLIVLIGGMVAVILLSMYLPMFKLGGTLMGN